jgi:glycosyltransferase involved in cell wall biosynthesis
MSRRPRKVLHVMNSSGGGAALSALALADAMAREGIVSCAVCHDVGTAEERQQVRDAMRGAVMFTRLYWWNYKIRMPLWRRPLAEAKQALMTGWSMASAARVRRFAVEHDVELIHTNTLLTPEGGLAARWLGLPHVWHMRELVGPGNPFRLPCEGTAFGSYMTQHCSKIVANSHTSAAQIRNWLPDGLLEVVPNGIDIDRFIPRPQPLNVGRPIVVGMVGNLTSRSKKHALFIEAAARVDRALPIQWRIYGHDPSRGGAASGSDPYVDELRDLIARAGLTERFHWPGFVADPVDIMSQLDLLVHPADNESFGRVVVEAMAAGLSVVGVRGGGVAEIIEPGVTGLLADSDDPRALAGCIEQLARDPQRRAAMGRAGRERALSNYSLAACTAGVLRVYEQAMQLPLNQPVAALSSRPTVAHPLVTKP